MAKASETNQRQSFPRALLDQPTSARLDYFKAYTVAHPLLSQADKAVWNAIREPAGALLIFVFGPTGVGKTTLLAHIEKRLIEQAVPRMEQEQDHVPVIRLDAVAPAVQQFRWSDYYQRALMALREPLLDHKIDYHLRPPVFNAKQNMFVSPRTRSRANVDELRLAFELALRYRQPKALLLDEAQHLAKLARGSRLLDQLDHLKSLAIMSQTVHVLAGTYDLLVFRNLSAQLSRRSVDIHLPRYRATNPPEQQAFRQVLLTFQRHLPLLEPPDLVHQWKYCYARTMGCVGILKDWLTKALAEALETGANTLPLELLERHALSPERCDQMITDCEEGEKLLTHDPTADERLLIRLGLLPRQRNRAKSQPQAEKVTPVTDPPVPSHTTRVGQRRPSRDPVKGEQVAHG
jgi:energy-coupling factor transporter ATP-binding protein EcfA2